MSYIQLYFDIQIGTQHAWGDTSKDLFTTIVNLKQTSMFAAAFLSYDISFLFESQSR